MKLGITASTLNPSGYGRWGNATYQKLKEHGYSASDFDMANTDSVLYTLPRKEAETILLHEKNLAQEAGIEITQVHGPWRYPPQDSTEEDRAERMEKMKESIRMTAILGCKNWVIHPLMPFGMDDIGTEMAQKTWDINLPFMRELLETAKASNVTICLENMPMQKFSISAPAHILQFVRMINDPYFKICLDTGHVSVFSNLNLGDEVRALGNEIRVLHVHDNKFGSDLHLMPYFGIIDWREFALALKDIQFDGSFSLETMPSAKLPNDIFDDMGKQLARIAQNILSDV